MSLAKDSFCTFVFDRLERIEGFRSRRMFDGVGLYAGPKFFGLIDERRLYFRTDEGSRSEYLAAGMSFFRPTPEQAIKNYYEVPADVLENDELLIAWAERAISVSPGQRQRS